MPFTSLDFAVFFACVLALNWRLRLHIRPYLPFLLTANLIFYGLAAPKFLPLLVLAALANWLCVRRQTPQEDPRLRKIVLALDVVFCLGLLAFFKYFEFLLQTFESLGLGGPLAGLFRLPEIVYPLGLSFYTFQGLSLAIDHYRAPQRPKPTFWETLAFVSFFPTVLSGPIQRADRFLAQLKAPAPQPGDLNLAVVLILSGLFKKVALSSYLSEHIVRGVFQMPGNYSALGTLAGIYGYSAQIYLDFSGYSDLAQGAALLLGFDVGRNFDRPYLAGNIRDFWRRWHISLSSWLRDYLYIPLGGGRRGSKTLNLVLTQALGGLWHGAHLRYLVWGLSHGALLAVHHLFRDAGLRKERAWQAIGFKDWQRPDPKWPRLKKWGGFLFTFNFVSFTWILFRADDLTRAGEVVASAFDWTKPGQGAPALVWLTAALALFGQKFGGGLQELFMKIQARLSVPALSLWCAFWVIMILKIGPDGVLPFIYFQY